MSARAGFELASSEYRSAALLVELSSPQGSEASFHPTEVHEMFSRQFNAYAFIQRRTGMPKMRVQIPLESTFFSLSVSDYHEKFLFLYL